MYDVLVEYKWSSRYKTDECVTTTKKGSNESQQNNRKSNKIGTHRALSALHLPHTHTYTHAQTSTYFYIRSYDIL